MRISDWSSDVCSSDLLSPRRSGRNDYSIGQDGTRALVSRTARIVVSAMTLEAGSVAQETADWLFSISDGRGLPGIDGLVAVENYERSGRSEEHTSELQSLMRISYAVFCLKKKKKT